MKREGFTDMNSPLDISRRHWETMKADLLTLYPNLSTDEEALFDTLDGLTNLTDQIAELMRSADMDKRFAKAISGKVEDLMTRKKWLEHKSQKKREVALQAMQDANIKKITEADIMVYRSKSKPGTQIIDEELIPERFFITVLKLDKVALRAVMDTGQEVPGATLSNATEKLTVR